MAASVVVVGEHRAAVGDATQVLGGIEAARDGGGRRTADRAHRAPARRPRPPGLRGRAAARAARRGARESPPACCRSRREPRQPRSSAAVSGSTSTKTGDAPVAHTAAAVGTAVKAGTITSSPGPTPTASNARRSASVPEATPTAWRRPVNAASSVSSASSSGPRRYVPDASTRVTAAERSGSNRAAPTRQVDDRCPGRPRSPVPRGAGSVELERAGDAVAERRARFPAQHALRLRRVAEVGPDVDGVTIGRPRRELDRGRFPPHARPRRQ